MRNYVVSEYEQGFSCERVQAQLNSRSHDLYEFWSNVLRYAFPEWVGFQRLVTARIAKGLRLLFHFIIHVTIWHILYPSAFIDHSSHVYEYIIIFNIYTSPYIRICNILHIYCSEQLRDKGILKALCKTPKCLEKEPEKKLKIIPGVAEEPIEC